MSQEFSTAPEQDFTWSRRGTADQARRSPRPPGRRRAPTAPTARLPRDVVNELNRVARPGKGAQAAARLERAVQLLERDDSHGAVAEAQKAKDLAPRSAAVREVLGIALYRAERFRDALRELQAYRRMTGRLDQNHLIADSHRALGAPGRALDDVRSTLRARVPEEVRAEATVVGASALADMGRFDEAIGMIRSFPTRERVGRPFDLRVWYVAGDILERAGRRSEAAAEFRRIVRHDASAFDAAERLAQLEAPR
jgi:tetratricopeptide (TPR) repeat protein